ncbi:MAG: alpha/beta fold hydrolase, partial [Chloroflexi bacterium]|nr:alpha/beta fold hydrolase [Chloroflexota bacterium]
MKSSGDSLLIRAKARLARWRVALLASATFALVALGGVVVGGWYISDLLRAGALEPDRKPDQLDLRVIALGEGKVTLAATDKARKDGDWTKDGIFGLEWEGGYGQVGAILRIDDEQVVREFSVIQGAPEIGELARLDSFAFPGDPEQAHGIGFEEVVIASELGELPAWFVDGPRDTWVIFVHGKGANRREALRMLPTAAGLGLPSLVITYRNDVEAPASPDGFYRYGQTEWRDLEAAVDYALQQGAKELVLVGYSMGGAIVTNFLYESPLAERVVGVILEAPMLDFGAVFDREAGERGMPGILTAVSKLIVGFRFDVDWGELNYLKRADELAVPILLFHGDDDPTAP